MDLTDRIEQQSVTVIPKFLVKKRRSHIPEPSMGQVMTSELLPFKNVMTLQLNKRGFNTKQLSFREIVALYYNEFVSNKENSSSPYEPINTFDFRNNASFNITPSDNFDGNVMSFKNQTHFQKVSGVVDKIIKQFRTSQLKKHYAIANGFHPRQSLTQDELIQANATDHIINSLEQKDALDTPVKTGQLINMIVFAFFVIVLYYILD